MSGKKPNSPLEKALTNIPTTFRKGLIKQYLEIKKLFNERKFEFCCIKVGKFCETLLRFLQNNLTGNYTPFGTKISNFINECDKFTKTPKSAGCESLRILIPHSLRFLYSIRSKRGIGHVSGDIDPNEMDSTVCVSLADWIMAELIRIFHGMSIEKAVDLIDSLLTRHIPLVWEVSGKKRVLDTTLHTKEKVIVLLYSDPERNIPVKDLFDWTEYSRIDHFKAKILNPLHKIKFIEYDKENKIVTLSPTGREEVENKILSKNLDLFKN
jgi:hypothetical protein